MKKIIILILIFITLPFLFINQSSSNIHDEFEIPTFIDLQNEIINSIDDMDINLTQVDIAYLETLKNNTEVLTLGYVGTEDDSFELYNNNEEYGIYSVIKYLIQKITDINVEYEYVDTFDELKNEVANNKITISPFTSTQSFDNFSSEYYIFEENWYLVYDKNNPKITSNLKVDSNEKLNFIKNSTIGKSDRFINDEFNKLKSLYNIDFTYETSSYPSSVENTMNELIGNPIYDMIPVYDVFELKDFISSPDIDYFTINDLIDVDFSGFGTNIENKQLSNIIYKLLVSNNLIEKYNIFLKNSRHHYIGDKFKESLTQNEKDLLVELSDIGGIDVVTSEQHPSLTIKNNTPSGLVPLITTHLQQLINTIDETNIDFNYKLVTDVDKEMTNNQFSISYNNTPSTTNSEYYYSNSFFKNNYLILSHVDSDIIPTSNCEDLRYGTFGLYNNLGVDSINSIKDISYNNYYNMIEDHKNGKFQFTIETESIYYSTRNTDEYYFQEIVCTPQDYFHYSNFIFQKEPPVGFTEDDVLTLNGILNKSLNTIDMDLINREWIGTNTSIDATTKTLSQTLFLSNLLMISFISILISALIIYTVDKINIHKTFDTLTNLYNRSYMEFLYHNSNKISGKRLTYFDLNKFKCINDTYGHKTGDLVLKRFSNILLENFRNDEVFRLSGDEFIVISDNSYTTSEFLTRIYNIQEKLSTDFKVPGTNYILNTSASIGITDPNITVNKSLHEILELADKTMYLSKVNENITFLDKHNYSTIQSEIDLINTLNNYDFENVKTILNPLYSLKNNKIAGYESVSKLLCDGKLLKFSSFSSFIKNKRKFDMQSYRNATSNMKLVGRENQILIIYFSHNSMELLGKVLNENKSGYKIVFELNEKIELSNTDNEIMKKLSSMGYSFLISNFSGGHHSLISLKYNYIGYIKFNPSIFEKIHINSDEIANFIDNFKNHFNVEVIVENIDTKEDYELYKNANIDYIQGNYFKN